MKNENLTDEKLKTEDPEYAKLLQVRDLSISFRTRNGTVPVVEQVNFQVEQGEIIGLVGESGCGKSVTAMSLLQLNAANTVYGDDSRILLNGKDLLRYKPRDLKKVRGSEISIIFQDSLTGLDPVMPLGKIMSEALRAHKKISRQEAREESIHMLARVGIPDPEARINEYSHQLSGGMRQRVMIALAMLHHSKLLIADEPTTALDVTIQDHILQLIRQVRDENSMSVLLITHDMGVVAEMTDRIYVMYLGRIVEQASVREIFENPLHPYTRGLLRSIPSLDMTDQERLYSIPGSVPLPGSVRKGCRFCGRCSECTERCRSDEPPLLDFGGHEVRCWKYETSMGGYL